MKRQFAAELQEGDQVNDYFIAARKDLKTQQRGGKFLGMVFKDRTGEVGGILWNNAASVANLFAVGDVVNVRGTVNSYQDRLQVRVEQVLPMREEEYDRADLVYVPEDITETFEKFRALALDIEDSHVRQLIQSVLDDSALMACFQGAAAGKKWHHAHPGGLVRHCYEMARLAQTMAELFPALDKDVLMAGIVFHDLGKLEEMTHDLVTEYTTPGKLLGHLIIGVEMAQRRMDAIEGFPEHLRLQILHCILAHHGELVNGSPVVPKTLEAIALYHIDNLDAQADAALRIIEETRQSGRQWSDYIPQIERQFWTRDEEPQA